MPKKVVLPDIRMNTPTMGLKFILIGTRIICNIPAMAVAVAALKNSHRYLSQQFFYRF
jgi:hypothetical protein